MGNRLTKIYTRTGDSGMTSTSPQTRLKKDDIQIQTLGDLDELNAAFGILVAHPETEAYRSILMQIQHRLFDIGGQICMPHYSVLDQADITTLENWIDLQNAALPPLKEFILPGGSMIAAHCHMTRTICRRAERSFVTFVSVQMHLEANTSLDLPLCYLNRLSDWLFVFARILNKQAQVSDVFWQKQSPI